MRIPDTHHSSAGRLAGRAIPRLSLRAIVLIIVAGVVVSTLALATITYTISQQRSSHIDSVGHEITTMRLYEDASKRVLEETTLVVAYLALQRPEFLTDFEETVASLDETFAQLSEHVQDDPAEAATVAGLQARHEALADSYGEFLRLLEAGRTGDALVFIAESQLEEGVTAIIEDIGIAVEDSRQSVIAAQVDSERTEAVADRATLAFGGVWVAVILLTAFATFRFVVRPIRNLEATANLIAEGDTEARVAPAGAAEVASLSHHINHMADALIERSEKLNAYLSQNLEQRTADLETANQQLEESERRFRALVQNSSDMIFIVDENAKVLYAGPSAERILGYNEEEWLAMDTAMSLIHPEDLDRSLDLLAAVAATPGVHPPVEIRLKHRDGTWRWLESAPNNLLEDPAVQGIVFNSRDITERKEAEEALRSRERRFQALVQNSSDMIVIVDERTKVRYASPSAERIMGYNEEELRAIGSVVSLIHPEDVEGAAASLAAVASTPGVHPPAELRLKQRDGSWRWLETVGNNLLHDPAVNGIVYNARDITERKEAEEAMRSREEHFRSLVQHSSDLITVVDTDANIIYQSPSSQPLLGYDAEELTGTEFTQLLHPDEAPVLMNFLNELASGAEHVGSLEIRIRRHDGSWSHVEVAATDLSTDPVVCGIVLNTRDISERKALEDQLRHRAFHDELTGLANRARFVDRLDHALALGYRQGRQVSVLFVDLDNFKALNDNLGHGLADSILVTIATRLEGAVRPDDTVARFGGDEFAILLEETSPDETATVSERVLQAMRQPIKVNGKEVVAFGSVGVALTEGKVLDAEELLRRADVAMYTAKSHGRNRVQVYEESMRMPTTKRLELLADLQRALERDEFVVHYQPTVLLDTGQIVGVEALVRWNHPRRGMLQPMQFVPLAEESGVIEDLGAWVLRQACAQVKAWQDVYVQDPPFHVSVNVASGQLHESFVKEVAGALDESGLAPDTLVLEVTEGTVVQDAQTGKEILQQLRALGVRIAIDDFGTGYSSLSYLRQFPVDIIKIDKSFVDRIAASTGQEHDLTRTIMDLSNRLHVSTVAEGIERADQLAQLQLLHCKYGQGFLFAEPAAPADITDLLNKAKRSAA